MQTLHYRVSVTIEKILGQIDTRQKLSVPVVRRGDGKKLMLLDVVNVVERLST